MGGVGMIPVTAIWAWSDRHAAPDWFVDVVRAIDVDQISRHAAERDRKAVTHGRQ
jgi:hypothetical protein